MVRYQVVDRSQSAHCCFEATVVDTSKPAMNAFGEPLDWFEEVCECFSLDDAEMIASALNATLKPETNGL